MRRLRTLVSALLTLALGPAVVGAQVRATLDVMALDGRVQSLTPVDLATLASERVTVLEDGVEVTYRGPALRALRPSPVRRPVAPCGGRP